MKGFIEVHCDKDEIHLLNVKHVKDVLKYNHKNCTIYLSFNYPGMISPQQNFITPRETYEEVKRMIEEAMK